MKMTYVMRKLIREELSKIQIGRYRRESRMNLDGSTRPIDKKASKFKSESSSD